MAMPPVSLPSTQPTALSFSPSVEAVTLITGKPTSTSLRPMLICAMAARPTRASGSLGTPWRTKSLHRLTPLWETTRDSGSWLQATVLVVHLLLWPALLCATQATLWTWYVDLYFCISDCSSHARRLTKPLPQYTYGQPRVGNEALAQYMTDQGSLYRVTHTNDIVPSVPPESFGFSHASPEYWITNGDLDSVDASDITEVDGVDATGGNAGSSSFLIDPHLWYFNAVTACLV